MGPACRRSHLFEQGYFTISLLGRPLFGSEMDEISRHGGRQFGFSLAAIESEQF